MMINVWFVLLLVRELFFFVSLGREPQNRPLKLMFGNKSVICPVESLLFSTQWLLKPTHTRTHKHNYKIIAFENGTPPLLFLFFVP